MTNYEKYRDQLIEMLAEGDELGLRNGEIVRCEKINCNGCEFSSANTKRPCWISRKIWLNAECIEKPKLTQREWHLCKAIETGWIARDNNGKLYRFEGKPSKNDEIWFHRGIVLLLRVIPNGFAFIRWQDEEPWSVEDLLKLEVEE